MINITKKVYMVNLDKKTGFFLYCMLATSARARPWANKGGHPDLLLLILNNNGKAKEISPFYTTPNHKTKSYMKPNNNTKSRSSSDCKRN